MLPEIDAGSNRPVSFIFAHFLKFNNKPTTEIVPIDIISEMYQIKFYDENKMI